MKRGIRFIYLFRHFNLTPVLDLDCTSSLQPAPILLHLPVCPRQEVRLVDPVVLQRLNDCQAQKLRVNAPSTQIPLDD